MKPEPAADTDETDRERVNVVPPQSAGDEPAQPAVTEPQAPGADPTARIVVRVLDERGSPAAEVTVVIVAKYPSDRGRFEDGIIETGLTGNDGSLELTVPDLGGVNVFVHRGRGAAMRGNLQLDRAEPLEVELRLGDAPPVRGVVRHENGAPVTGAPVVGRFQTAPLSHWTHYVHTTSGSDGEFTLTGVPLDHRGREAFVNVPHVQGVFWGGETRIEVGAFDELVLVETPRICRVRGHFVDSDDDPIEPARGQWRSRKISYDTGTDDDGRIDISLPYGTYDAEMFPMLAAAWERKDIVLDRAELDLGTIVLPPGVALRGTVLNADGTPAAQANVKVSSAWWAVATDEDGRFEVLHLNPGPHRVAVRADGNWGWEESSYIEDEITVPTDSAVMRLDDGRFLSLRFQDADGAEAEVRKVVLLVSDPESGDRVYGHTWKGRSHRARRRLPRAGTFDVTVTVDDREPVRFPRVVIQELAETALHVTLSEK